MDRRTFGRVLLGIAAAAVTVPILASQESTAAPMPVIKPDLAAPESERIESDFRPDVDALPTADTVQWRRGRRRRGRVFGRRRRRRRGWRW